MTTGATMRRYFPLVLLIIAALLAVPQNPPLKVGPHPEGGYLLTTGWRVSPEGKLIRFPSDTFPMNVALHPDGKHLFILNAGYMPPSVMIFDTETEDKPDIVRVGLQDAWLGLAINKAGDRFYVPEGNLGTVREFSFQNGEVKPQREYKLFEGVVDPSKRGKARLTKTDYLGDAALSPDGRWLFVANLQNNLVHAVDLEKVEGIKKWAVGRRPYRILPAAGRIYVSLWGDDAIQLLDTAGKPVIRFQTGAHPTDMLLHQGRLYVTCGNTNYVYVHDADTGVVREQINIALHPKSPPGSTPNALALSPDGSKLYVANADNNAVAVVALSERGSRVEGFIPTGWYPTAVAVSRDGRRIYIANGKGERSYPNPGLWGPQTQRREGSDRDHYVGRLQKGSLSIVATPDEKALETLTKRVVANSPYRDELLVKAAGPGNPIPVRPGEASPIKHAIYVIKENRTYDQVFGDIKEGNGDPRLVLFGEPITPNQHRLAREFVLFDNFYVNADVSADGHAWTVGAISNDFISKLWPGGYGGRRNHYDSEGEDEAGTPGGGWLFHSAIKAGVSFRTYGEWVSNGPTLNDPVVPRDKALVAGTYDPQYRGWDLEYPDVKRAERWISQLREFEKRGEMPRLQILRLGNNHTSGTAEGKPSPRAAVADNDLAVGRIIEALSHSRFWRDTAVFILEDDAQNGPDHVDSHRSPALVISPYVKRRVVDSTLYSTVSMLRTIELILGLPPLSQYDAGATAMFAAFTDKPDLTPYTAVVPKVDLNEKNTARSPLAALSATQDFSELDRIDMDVMNRILWVAMKGDTPMPAPVSSVFPALWVYRVR
jgi:YVTN family beta-propeller protein